MRIFTNTFFGFCISLILFVSVFAENKEDKKRVLFFGDSLTAGYGIGTDNAFPNLIQTKIDSSKLNYEAVNAGLSGETTAGGLRRINWILKRKIDVFVLELGANDGLRGISPKVTKQNLQKIIDNVLEKNPETKIILAGMLVPPNLGIDYAKEFAQVFPTLAEENKIPLIPFLLDGVAGDKKLNIADGIHPNIEGHKIVAENVWQVLKSELEN
ncbi:MAG: arylesterase [Calditrichaeota bacterium]|nr:MAG: arylesterase [Calditrichota bacterium]